MYTKKTLLGVLKNVEDKNQGQREKKENETKDDGDLRPSLTLKAV